METPKFIAALFGAMCLAAALGLKLAGVIVAGVLVVVWDLILWYKGTKKQ